MRNLQRIFIVAFFLFTACLASAQITLKKVADLQPMLPNWLELDVFTGKLLLSDGYYLLAMDTAFKKVDMLANTYPKYSYAIERFSNQRAFIRHHNRGLFDFNKPIPWDSSGVYYKLPSGKDTVIQLPPYLFFTNRITKDSASITAIGFHQFVHSANDSFAFLQNAGIVVTKQKDGKQVYSKVFELQNEIKVLWLSLDADWLVAGTNKGKLLFYNLNIDSTVPFEVVLSSPQHFIGKVFFNRALKELYAIEYDFADNFSAVVTVTLESLPVIGPKSVNDDFGVKREKATFTYNEKANRLYVQHGLTFLKGFDLSARRITEDFSNYFSLGYNDSILRISAIAFSSRDSALYLTAEMKQAPGVKLVRSNLFRIETAPSLPVVKRTAKEESAFYEDGMRTYVTQLPGNDYSGRISVAKNGVALLTNSNQQYKLIDIRTGKTLHNFTMEGNVSISPDGVHLLAEKEYRGIGPGIADTVRVKLVNLQTGRITKSEIVLIDKYNEELKSWQWSKSNMPVCIVTGYTAVNNFHKVSVFELNADAQPQLLDTFIVDTKNSHLSETYSLRNGGLLFVKSNFNSDGSEIFISTSSDASPLRIVEEPKKTFWKIRINEAGILVCNDLLPAVYKWFDFNGKLLSSGSLKINGNWVLQDKAAILGVEDGYSTKAKLVEQDLISGIKKEISVAGKLETGISGSLDGKYLCYYSGEKLKTWQRRNDRCYLLYEIQHNPNFDNAFQLTDKRLVVEGNVWNLENAQLEYNQLRNIVLLNDTTILSTAGSYDIWDYRYDENFKRSYFLKPHGKVVSKTGKSLSTISEDEFYKSNEWLVSRSLLNKSELLNIFADVKFEISYGSEVNFHASPDGKLVLLERSEILSSFGDGNSSFSLIDIEKGTVSKAVQLKPISIKWWQALNGFLLLVDDVQQRKLKLILFNSDGNKVLADYDKGIIWTDDRLKIGKTNYTLTIVDGHTVASLGYDGITLHNFKTKQQQGSIHYEYRPGVFYTPACLYYDEKTKMFFACYSDGAVIKVNRETAKAEAVVKVAGKALEIVGRNSRFLLAKEQNGSSYYFLTPDSLVAKLRLITWQGREFSKKEFIWLTEDNYYYASPAAGNTIHFVKGLQPIPLREADLTYNRPDKVLQVLGASEEEIKFYRQLYEIRRAKYKTSQASTAVKTSLGVKSNLQFETDGTVSIDITPAVENSNLLYLHIMVNGCPFYGVSGKKITTTQLPYKETILLNSGQNLIYVWINDAEGNKSNVEEHRAVYDSTFSGKWFFVGVGVSDYADSTFNLRYADKDIRDLAAQFGKRYTSILLDTLLNGNVNRTAFQKLKASLINTHPEDKVVLSMSGHGLLDEKGQFWFATHTMDFDDPTAQGISMGDIVSLLDSIPARYRLVTLDACHSGEQLNLTDSILLLRSEEKLKVISYTPKGATVKNTDEKRPYSGNILKNMQAVFTDYVSNTGINVVAASAGSEYALEGNDWNNGVFTYALINGWLHGHAGDKYSSSNRKVHYRDFTDYVKDNVSALTGGRQTPNTLMENGDIDWWLVPAK
ncbi:MAG: caspase family protein [Chitinophagales bacterium]|nr:caspase family protein [Chitinophagales bacterium]